jgi:hypothetical protein
MISEEYLKKYGMKSISTIAEATMLPVMYIKHLDESVYRYTMTREDMTEDGISLIIKNHVKEIILKNRKEKLIRLNEFS